MIFASLLIAPCVPEVSLAEEAPSEQNTPARRSTARPAATAGSGSNASAAQVLFDAGRRAMERNQHALACQKFYESQRLQAAVGTLLNLGHCEEKRGNIASAWHRYTEALDLMEEGDRRQEFARRKTEALEPRIPRLTVVVEPMAPPDVRVTRDGQSISRELGAPVRLDPGRFVVVAEAAGHETRVFELALRPGDNKRLRVGVGQRIAPNSAQGAPDRRNTRSGKSTLGYVFLGSGIAAGAAGATFGALTYDEYQTVRDHCDLETSRCFDATGQQAASTGATYEKLAYILGGTSLVSLSVGSILLLSDDDADSRERTATVSLVLNSRATKGPGLQLSGTF